MSFPEGFIIHRSPPVVNNSLDTVVRSNSAVPSTPGVRHKCGADASPPGALAQVIAARSSLLILAAPMGTALGGPIVAALGARGTLLTSGLATVALGLATAAALARARR